MNYRQKLGYIVVGGLLMLIGMTAANLRADNPIGTTEVVVGSALALVGIVSIFAAVSRQTEGDSSVEGGNNLPEVECC